ncbi:CheR family methyltransferase [Acetobacterium tundrae]|uniref:protein-glutamate O-methyltransferase n=1 Tax=Acetobacterium tundrae TaxID=132932 RepID=A0ABR6WI75_9FIRM|nr:protein-glutamate O-methyltransferase CheR [Acetobacterium tundrae]MBC3796147.1 chemotaxis protein CheR [Acetobacterium tundrae]
MIEITKEEYALLTAYIYKESGINLKKNKELLLVGRLRKLLIELGFDSFSEYYHYLINDKTGGASSVLIDKVSTNHTYFMREADHFEYFKNTVLPDIKKTKENEAKHDIRLWCAASSTGEEPYTLSCIMKEYFEKDAHLWNTSLLATDISTTVLVTAKKGIYSCEDIEPLPRIWKLKYFVRQDDNFVRVSDEIRDNVIFRRFNLMNPVFPFSQKLDVIFCRNVMIYFDQPTKDRLSEKMYDCLEPGGYLFIGHSESIDLRTTKFKYMMPSVYQKCV